MTIIECSMDHKHSILFLFSIRCLGGIQHSGVKMPLKHSQGIGNTDTRDWKVCMVFAYFLHGRDRNGQSVKQENHLFTRTTPRHASSGGGGANYRR